ncbi:hypothetical protein PN925_001259 [Morganella morganii]
MTNPIVNYKLSNNCSREYTFPSLLSFPESVNNRSKATISPLISSPNSTKYNSFLVSDIGFDNANITVCFFITGLSLFSPKPPLTKRQRSGFFTHGSLTETVYCLLSGTKQDSRGNICPVTVFI